MKKLNLKHFLIISVFVLLGGLVGYALINTTGTKKQEFSSPFMQAKTEWADSTLKYLPVNEKIAQLFFYNIGKIDTSNESEIISNLNKFMPGGIVFKTDSLADFIKYQNNFQKISKINLLTFVKSNTAIPQFKDFNTFPNFNNLFSVKEDSLIENYIKQLAKLNKQLNISFSLLPEIKKFEKDTSFKNKYAIILNYLHTELKENKIISCMKQTELFEFDSANYVLNKSFIDAGLLALISNNQQGRSEAVSLPNDFKKQYKFGGFSVVDISDNEISEDSILSLINSGTELFISKQPEKLINKISNLIDDEKISEESLNQIVRKILLAKTWTGLENNIRIEIDSVKKIINKKQIIASLHDVYKNSISLIKNENGLIPFKNLQKSNFVIVNIGKNNINKFKEVFKTYHKFKSIEINIEKDDVNKKLSNIKKSANIIFVANNMLIDSALTNNIFENKKFKNAIFVNFGNERNLNYTDSFSSIIQVNGNSEFEQKYLADALFGGIAIKGHFLSNINDSLYFGKSIETIKIRVANSLPETEGLNPQILLKIDSIAKNGIRRGAFPGCQIVILKNGNAVYDKSFGYHTYSKQRRVRHNDLYDLASVTKIAATTTAAMRMYDKGRLKLNSNLGRYFKDTKIDYSNIEADTIINIDTLLFSEVKDFKKLLRHQDTIHINDSMFMAYDTLIVTATPKNNIFKVKIKDLLIHKSGISPTLPILPYVIFKKNFYDSLTLIKQRFYEKFKDDSLHKDTVFDKKTALQKIYDEYFTRKYIKDSAEIKIADNFYFQNRYFDTLWRDTKRLRVYSRKIYQYSDINMILLQQAIDSTNHRGIDRYLRTNIYQPMGLNTMCYKPTKYFSKYNIVPTENDKYWREQLLRGNVHDPSAAMLGRVSGNAGLFSNAYDLAVLGQMWLNAGIYGGRRYISENTIKKFTGFQEDSHRGLGFDKPTRKSIIGKGAPVESYGHTGFTGTCIWVDPVNDIVFVFLSNRVHPSAKNWRINTLKIRQKIHTVVYDAMKE